MSEAGTDVVDGSLVRDGPRPSFCARTGHASIASRTPIWANRRLWRWAAYAALLALLAVEGVFLGPYLANAVADLRDPDAGWLALAVFAEIASMGAFARLERRMLIAAGRRVSAPPIVALTWAANALSVTLPGGTALSAGYVFRRLRSWGATVPAAGFTVVASGVLSTVAFAMLAVLSGLLAGGGGLSSYLTLAAVAVLAVGTLAIRRHRSPDMLLRWSSRTLRRANALLRRRPDAGIASVERFARELTAIKPRGRDWLIGLWFASLNWVADLVCLVACCEAVDAGPLSIAIVLVAYIAGMSAASVSLLPGGFGLVDAAMIFALTRGGVGTVSATAAVVLYRLISFAMVVLLGWVVWVTSLVLDRRRATGAGTAAVAIAFSVDGANTGDPGPTCDVELPPGAVPAD